MLTEKDVRLQVALALIAKLPDAYVSRDQLASGPMHTPLAPALINATVSISNAIMNGEVPSPAPEED